MSLSITRNYSANNVLTEAQLDAAFDSIETKFNSTLIDASDIASSAVTTAKINDGAVTSVKRLVTTAAKTADYTATTSDEFIAYDVSGASRTLTLYAASGNAGRRLIVKRTDQTLANSLTIDGNASETIDGATTTTLNTQYEQVTLVCDGSNWHIVERYIPSVWTSYTPTGAWTANTTYTGFWRRAGDSIQVQVRAAISGTPTSATFTASIPSGLAIDTAKITTTTSQRALGNAMFLCAGSSFMGTVCYSSTTTVQLATIRVASADTHIAVAVTQAVPGTFANTDELSLIFTAPISGWKG